MKILALELSTARGSIAALDDNVDLAREWANDRKHSGLFFDNLQEVTKKLGAPEMIVVGLGPGSYAGTRIAISAAIGLATVGGTGSVSSPDLGRHGGRPSIKLAGLPSICAFDALEYCVIGDARRNSFFFAQVRANDLVEGPTLFGESELKAKLDKLDQKMSIFCSEELPRFERAILRYPSAKILARLAQNPNRNFALPPLEPIYLREPHITIPKSTATS